MAPPLPTWHFIVNPAAGGGRARRRWRAYLPQLRAALPGMSFAISTPQTSLGALARDAVEMGKTHLVGVGGDGTHHHLVNALVATGRVGEVTYAPLPLGSGNDWVRSLGVPEGLADWLAYLRRAHVRSHLIGRIDFLDAGRSHHFINVAGFAYDADVVRIAVEERVRKRWMYPLLALSYLWEYRAPSLRLTHHPRTGGRAFTQSHTVHTVNIGIGRYSGGGMQFVPHADPFGEDLALTVLDVLPRWKVLANAWRLYNGTIARLPQATLSTTATVWLTELHRELACEADGEYLGTGRVRITPAPERLLVCCGEHD